MSATADPSTTAPGVTARPRAVTLAFLQGGFFFVSGIWPILHMASFVAVTGPKTDYWLVRTVGALLAVIGACLLRAAQRQRVTSEVKLLAAFAPIVLAAIDIIYVSTHVIAPIYLADAAVELVIAIAWLVTPSSDAAVRVGK